MAEQTPNLGLPYLGSDDTLKETTAVAESSAFAIEGELMDIQSKDAEQDGRLDVLEAAPPGGGGTYVVAQYEPFSTRPPVDSTGFFGVSYVQGYSGSEVSSIQYVYMDLIDQNGHRPDLKSLEAGDQIVVSASNGNKIYFQAERAGNNGVSDVDVRVDPDKTIQDPPDQLWDPDWLAEASIEVRFRDGGYDDTEVRGLISDNADKNDEQDDRLDALEAVPPPADYDDSWLLGGKVGQVLTKVSGTDKDVYWATPSSGGGGGSGGADDPDFFAFDIIREWGTSISYSSYQWIVDWDTDIPFYVYLNGEGFWPPGSNSSIPFKPWVMENLDTGDKTLHMAANTHSVHYVGTAALALNSGIPTGPSQTHGSGRVRIYSL